MQRHNLTYKVVTSSSLFLLHIVAAVLADRQEVKLIEFLFCDRVVAGVAMEDSHDVNLLELKSPPLYISFVT